MTNVRLTLSSKGEGITTPSLGSHYVEKESRIYISALASSGWYFEGWTGDLSGSDSTRLIIMNTDKNVTACFHKVVHKLTLKVNGHGIIKRSSDNEVYEHGSFLRITAVPDDGWRFIGWAGDLSGNRLTQSFVINSDKNIIADFHPVHTLIISSTGHGTTTPRPGTYQYDHGSRIYVSALAESGWKLDQWTGDISGRDSTRILTMNSDKKIAADFQLQYRSGQPVILPTTYIANRRSGEIHLSDCRWVRKMKETNRILLQDFNDVALMIKNNGYNGCFYCLSRYDRDTLTFEAVVRNLETDSTRQYSTNYLPVL